MKKILLYTVLIFTCSTGFAQTTHTGTISANETWLAADNPHLITGNLTIQAPGTGITVVVTLDAGVQVKFDGNYYISVGSNNANYPGALKAEGTEPFPVTITSNTDSPAPGDWNSIRFYNYADDTLCSFEYTLFEYGGSSISMIRLETSSPTFDNCTFQNMNQSAITPANNSSGAYVTNCTFEAGNSYPLTCYAKMVHLLGSGNSYSANAIQAVQVYGEVLLQSRFWASQSIPYRITNNHMLVYGASGIASVLTLGSGAVLEFSTGYELQIGHYLYSDRVGAIMADNVTFKGIADSANAWFGIRIRDHSLGDSNRFNNCTFQNASYGIYAENNSSFHVNNSTFTGNTIASSVHANDVYGYESGNVYIGNTDNRIEVRGGIISNSATWTMQDTPLHIISHIFVYGAGGIPAVLTIEPDAILEFETGAEIQTGHYLYTDRIGGIMADNVTFKGAADSAGAWFGIRTRTYSYGDSNRFNNCTFQNASYGIYSDNNSSFHVNNSTFTGNAIASSAHANDVYCYESGNVFIGNTDNRIEVRSGIISNSTTWTTQDTPFHVIGHLSVYGAGGIPAVLTIEPDAVLEFETGVEIQTGHYLYTDRIGGIMADGVTFKGVVDSPGSWFGIRTRAYSYGDSNRFNNCTFQNASYGIYADNNSSFHVNNSTFTGNAIATSALANEVFCYESGNVYTGNTDNRIEVRSDIISNSATWTTQDTPFHIIGTVDINSSGETPNLRIQEGAILEFAPNTALVVGHYLYSDRLGSLSAEGVIFTADEPTPGSWRGIVFRRYSDSENSLLYNSTIEYAGNGNYGNIWCDGASPTIRNCTIRHSANFGIKIEHADSTPEISQCTIISNDVGIYCAINSDPIIGGAPGNGNIIEGNTTFGVQNVSSGVVIDATYNWWGDVSGPYDSSGTIEVPPCSDSADNLNTDGLGDNVSNYVDYCPWNEAPSIEAPSLFSLLSPTHTDTLWDTYSFFEWETSTDLTPGDVVHYKLEICSGLDYEPGNTLTIDNLTGTMYETSEGELSDDTRYNWRVTAFDTQGYFTNCSQQNWYTDIYIVEPPNNFDLQNPNNYETVMRTSPLMNWEVAIDPDPGDSVSYTVYLDDTEIFLAPNIIETSETSIYPPFCTPGTEYYWKVKATDNFGNIMWSDVFSFFVHFDAGPRAPIWVNISKNGNNFNLDWEVVPGSDSYNIEHSTQPYSGFVHLDYSETNSYSHIDAALEFSESYYRIKAIDNVRIQFWRDMEGETIPDK
jgi:hypothetical protein